MNFSSFNIKDFYAVKPQANEFANLELEFKRLHQSGQLLSEGQKACESLTGDHQAATQQIHVALRCLESYAQMHPVIQNIIELLTSSEIQLQEASAELENYLEKMDINLEQLQSIESRMSELHSLSRKYRLQPEQLCEFQTQLEYELSQESTGQSLENLKEKWQLLCQQYDHLALSLSQSRQKAAKELEQHIQQQLKRLGMAGVDIQIQLEPVLESLRNLWFRRHSVFSSNQCRSSDATPG